MFSYYYVSVRFYNPLGYGTLNIKSHNKIILLWNVTFFFVFMFSLTDMELYLGIEYVAIKIVYQFCPWFLQLSKNAQKGYFGFHKTMSSVTSWSKSLWENKHFVLNELLRAESCFEKIRVFLFCHLYFGQKYSHILYNSCCFSIFVYAKLLS